MGSACRTAAREAAAAVMAAAAEEEVAAAAVVAEGDVVLAKGDAAAAAAAAAMAVPVAAVVVAVADNVDGNGTSGGDMIVGRGRASTVKPTPAPFAVCRGTAEPNAPSALWKSTLTRSVTPISPF